MPTKLAAVVLSYNDTNLTRNVCNILIDIPEVDYIVVADNSDESSFLNINSTVFSCLHPSVYYLKSRGNNGYAAGNNLAIKFIQDNLSVDYIWILNNDTIPQPGCASSMLEMVKSHDNKVICGSVLYYYSKSNEVTNDSLIQCYGGGRYFPILGKSKLCLKNKKREQLASGNDKMPDFILGASMIVPIHLFNIIGLIPEEYFLYFEELDWQTVAKKKGFELVVAEHSEVIHFDAMSTANKKCNYYYYMNRSAIIYTRKHYSYFLLTVILYHVFETVVLTAGFKNKFYSLKGIKDGILFKQK